LLDISNSVISEHISLVLNQKSVPDSSIRLNHNTWCADTSPLQLVFMNTNTALEPAGVIQIDAAGNIFDGEEGVFAFDQWVGETFIPLERATQVFPRLVRWRGRENLHQAKILSTFKFMELPGYPGTKTLDEWNKFWGLANTDSQAGRPAYAAGDVAPKLANQWERITAADFRLRSDSPGYRAGKDGKDMGADIDLVGPGEAYSRWQKTPEYQQWLKDTGQKKSSE
jgi:hypothetical protein